MRIDFYGIVDLFQLVSACLRRAAGGIGFFGSSVSVPVSDLRYDLHGIGMRGQAMLDSGCIAVSTSIMATLMLGALSVTATYLSE